LHGQNKDALAKMQKGNWKYDIVEAGYKCNMTDIMAAIGLVELSRYEEETLPVRKKIIERYQKAFAPYSWAQLPIFEDAERVSSFHLYPLRIKGIDEARRDAIIQDIFNRDVSVNVHFIPLPLLSFYKKMGYSIEEYPITYRNFSAEISLPVFEDLTNEMQDIVIKALIDSVQNQLSV
jgi:dTDP-4-amino-4,6-dideoxygalactose transaminase